MSLRLEIHDRMSVIVHPEDRQAWLAGEELPLVPFPSTGMAEFVRQRPIAHAWFDAEFRNSRLGVVMKAMNGSLLGWSDPKSVTPLLISFAFVEAGKDGNDQLYRFVVDARESTLLPYLQVVLDPPVPFCCHSASANLQCLWQLGLREPRVLWDSWVAQRVQLLGRFHARNDFQGDDVGHPAGVAELEIASRCELVTICRQHGIEYPFSDKDRGSSTAPTIEINRQGDRPRKSKACDAKETQRSANQKRADRSATEPLLSVPTGLIRILNRDLQAAGIPKTDERGRTLDVHSLRHSPAAFHRRAHDEHIYGPEAARRSWRTGRAAGIETRC